MESITQQVLALQTKSLPELRQMWQALFLQSAPLQPAVYLRPRLAYRLQELKLGGLSNKTRQELSQKIAQLDPKTLELARLPSNPLLPGTRLMRQWQGITHEVEVLTSGFNYQGQRFKSLSAIARKITGTQWNGPAFFGMRSSKCLGEKA